MIIIRPTSYILLYSLLITLSGCATSPQQYPQHKWSIRHQHLTKFSDWHISGKVSFRENGKGEHASFKWQQQSHNFNIKLHGPMNTNNAFITGNQNNVQFTNTKGEKFTASTVEELLENHLNMKLPISKLQYWIKGVPAPTPSPHTQVVDNHQLLEQLEQAGWNITYDNYKPVNSLFLPHTLNLKSQEISIKIVISRWKSTHLGI